MCACTTALTVHVICAQDNSFAAVEFYAPW